jgi:hypothetical protein
MFFRNVGELPDCMVLRPRTWCSSKNKGDMKMCPSPMRRHDVVSVEMSLPVHRALLFYSYTAIQPFIEPENS